MKHATSASERLFDELPRADRLEDLLEGIIYELRNINDTTEEGFRMVNNTIDEAIQTFDAKADAELTTLQSIDATAKTIVQKLVDALNAQPATRLSDAQQAAFNAALAKYATNEQEMATIQADETVPAASAAPTAAQTTTAS